MSRYDAIVIGGGHNGLVCAATLARAGRRTLLLERRSLFGGLATSEESVSGCRMPLGALDAGLLHSDVIAHLELESHGLRWVEPAAVATGLAADGHPLTLWRDPERTRADVAALSRADAAAFAAFQAEMTLLAGALDALWTQTPPDLQGHSLRELWPWLKTALKIRRMGDREMMTLLRVLPMTVREYLDEWFETDRLKALLAVPALRGTAVGAMAAGTMTNLIYQHGGGSPGGWASTRFPEGGMAGLSGALVSSARSAGVELVGNGEATRIETGVGGPLAVHCMGGQVYRAPVVVSAIGAGATFLNLIGADQLPLRLVRRLRHIRYRGVTARITLVLDELPEWPDIAVDRLGGYGVICPSMVALERSADAAKYGRWSDPPLLEWVIPTLHGPGAAPQGKHLMAITARHAPYRLREAEWGGEREAFVAAVLAQVERHLPGIGDTVSDHRVLLPVDYEREFGLCEGDPWHGQMMLDQLFVMRPTPECARYATPVPGLYLAGAASHPGGGVTGLPGFNAAREVLRKSR